MESKVLEYINAIKSIEDHTARIEEGTRFIENMRACSKEISTADLYELTFFCIDMYFYCFLHYITSEFFEEAGDEFFQKCVDKDGYEKILSTEEGIDLLMSLGNILYNFACRRKDEKDIMRLIVDSPCAKAKYKKLALQEILCEYTAGSQGYLTAEEREKYEALEKYYKDFPDEEIAPCPQEP